MTMLNATPSSGLAQFESYLPWTPHFTLAAVLVGLLGTLYTYFFSSGNDTNKIHALGGFSVVNAWMFFNKRYDFLWSNFNKTGHDLFSFKVLHHQVVAMSGDEARKIFFNEKNLNFQQGYRLLMGGGPRFEDIKADEDESAIMFKQRLLKILHRDRLQDVIPTLFSDISRRMENWGEKGTIDPFKDIYGLVFQMTVRMGSCQELATDPAMVQKMGDLYWELEQNATLVSLLLPWLPSPAGKTRRQATKSLSDMVSHYVEVRRNADVPNLDAIDVLIADGADTPSIVHFVLGTIFAGVINTGMISCWVLLHLGFNNAYKQKTIAEVQNLIAEYTNTSSSEPIHQRLSTIPISAWEDEMPVIESVIRETLRILGSGTPLRRNLTDDLRVAGKTIDKGAFMVYNSADVHLNERFYPEPLKFDPDRFNLTGEDDTQGKAPFLGWGTGRHPCAGMKVAKLEIKMILALFLYRYEYTLVDQSGKPAKQLPQLDRNCIQKKKPMGEPCYLMYRKVAE